MFDIFISYRRSDSRADAGRLYDRLNEHFGDTRVFMDIDDIAPGADFVQSLAASLDHCGVMLVVIGRNWLATSDSAGPTRLHDEHDFVRVELLRAIERGIRVIPVLVGGATMPADRALPEPLAPLVRFQAVELSDSRFHEDVNQLIESLHTAAGHATLRHRGLSKRLRIGAAAIMLAGLSVTLIGLHTTRATRAEVALQLEIGDRHVANNDFEPADQAYRAALSLDAKNAKAYRKIVAATRERFLREGLGNTGHISLALGPDNLRLAPIPGAPRAQIMNDLQTLHSLDPESDENVDVLLDEALILKAAVVDVQDALPILARAHALAPKRADILAELGMLQTVVSEDAGGIARVREAIALEPDTAQWHFYLGEALSANARCTRRGSAADVPDAALQCADALRAFRRSFDQATGEDYWARHLRHHAVRVSLDIFHSYAANERDMLTPNLALSVPERIDAIEFLREHEHSASRGGWYDYPEYWLAILYEADGRPQAAREILDELFAARGRQAAEWRAVYERVTSRNEE